MKDKPARDRQQPKKTYTKPEVKKVPLKPEEAVLGFCKISSNYGPIYTNYQDVSVCYTIGT